jgi:hypothetical protein
MNMKYDEERSELNEHLRNVPHIHCPKIFRLIFHVLAIAVFFLDVKSTKVQ